MIFLDFLRSRISPQNPFLLLYHKFVAIAAALIFGFPGRKLNVIAVTGTKGKSTTVHLIAAILQAAGMRAGVASSIHFQIAETIEVNDTKQTTQGRFRLQQILCAMVKAKCKVAVLEVTSHALVQSRLWGIPVDTAVLTNIDKDHLEYHGGLPQYREAKGRLFQKGARCHVLPEEDVNFAYFEKFPAQQIITYGIQAGRVRAEKITLEPQSSQFILCAPQGEISIQLHLPGEFNVRNALAAASAALSLGISPEHIKKGLESLTVLPGRQEEIRAGQSFRVIVDYAHTPDSLQKLLAHYKPQTNGKLYLVFGATGGGRDKSKRPEMGRVADQYADGIVVTDDDPYTEDRAAIIEQVASGIKRAEGHGLWKIKDRRQAISHALKLAKNHDTVIIAGKGCEPIQIIGKNKIPWDDRAVVREFLTQGHQQE